MQKKEMYHVGIYLRLSREDSFAQSSAAGENGLESNSIRSQRELCRSFVAKRQDMTIYDIYIDM